MRFRSQSQYEIHSKTNMSAIQLWNIDDKLKKYNTPSNRAHPRIEHAPLI